MKINEPRGIDILPMRYALEAYATLLLALVIGSCAAPDTRHQIVISTREQKLAVLDRGNQAPDARHAAIGQLRERRCLVEAIFFDHRRVRR